VTRLADQRDVVVVGAGPAGSTAAQLLASWGWSVILVHRPTAPGRPSLAESLPASTRKLFAFLGQLEGIEAAGFYPNQGNVARWAEAPRVTRSPDAGFHVPRGPFDEVLRAGAVAAGATKIDATVRAVELDGEATLTVADENRRVDLLRARMILDCSGRAGVVARRGLRRSDAPYRTLAIAAEWETAAWPAEEHAQTLVESYPDGWAWSVPLSKTRRQCTVMIDTARSPGHDGRGLNAIYQRELERSAELRARLRGATQITSAWTCDATVYDSARQAETNALLVGDAASFIEPLSSAGVKKALLSAWRAAVVANTCLRNPGLTAAALDLYNRREHQVYADCMQRTSVFFAEATAVYGTPFWSARAASDATVADLGEDPDAPAAELSDAALARDPAVRLAFDRLRETADVRLRASEAVRFEPVATIEGREVVMRDALIVPGVDAPLQFAAGVNLPALARLAAACGEVPALIEAYQTEVGPVPVTGLLKGLSLLVARQAVSIADCGLRKADCGLIGE
jgi:flavin-dependent dehydrogenase